MTPAEHADELVKFAASALRSLELMAVPTLGFLEFYPAAMLTVIAAPPRQRCVLARQFDQFDVRRVDVAEQARFESLVSDLKSLRWEVKLAENGGCDACLIVDRDCALVSSFDERGWRADHVWVGGQDVKHINTHFDTLWRQGDDLEVLYSWFATGATGFGGHVLTMSNEAWASVIRELVRDPRGLYGLSPRRFEELVAELLRSDGFEVSLTSISRDGGRDVLAFLPNKFGTELYLVECKRYAADRPVGVSLVRNLYGVVEADRATKGLLVTTSYFSHEARDLQKQLRYRLDLSDYADLTEWLRAHGTRS